MRITASTPLYALLGHPVGQSLSPILQNGWIREHGFDAVYVALDVKPEHFPTALQGLHQSGLKGANVTAPLKELAAHHALCLTPRAEATNSVNCLSHNDQGFLGDSTDGAGFISDLDRRAPGWRHVEGPVVLIGAGGAARAILQALIHAGVQEIILINRDPRRAQTAIANMPQGRVIARSWQDLPHSLIGASLVINATTAGFKGESPLELDVSKTNSDCVVYDSVYVPRATAFLISAQRQNRRALDGLGMLVGQGALAFEAWFGVMPDVISGLSRLEAELAL